MLASWIFVFFWVSGNLMSFHYFLFQGIRGPVGLPGPLGVKGQQVYRIKIWVCLFIFSHVFMLGPLQHLNMLLWHRFCVFLSLTLGTYRSTRTEGNTRDARSACMFHVEIIHCTLLLLGVFCFNQSLSSFCFLQFTIMLLFMLLLSFIQRTLQLCVKFPLDLYFPLFCLGYVILWIKPVDLSF